MARSEKVVRRMLTTEEAAAYLGTTVPGFPNLFLVYGPHTNLGGSSILSMIECQAGYLGQAAELLGSALNEKGLQQALHRPKTALKSPQPPDLTLIAIVRLARLPHAFARSAV